MFERIKEYVVGPKITRPDSFRNKAVLVVDLQYGYMSDMNGNGGKGANFGAIEQLLKWARLEKVELVFLENRDQTKRAGTTIPCLIETPERNKVIEKWVPDGFADGRLFQRLNKLRVRDLIICGYAKEICVYETARSARKFGFGIESAGDLIFGSNGANPSAFKKAILDDFYTREIKMHLDVGVIIQSSTTCTA